MEFIYDLSSDEQAYFRLEIKRLSDKNDLLEKLEDDDEVLSRFTISDCELSDAVSEYIRLQGDSILMHYDMNLHGAPGECHQDEDNSFEKALEEFYERLGLSEEQFRKAVALRTSKKFARFGIDKAIQRYVKQNTY